MRSRGSGNGRLSVWSVRFMRDVTASVLAAGIAAVAFSHLSREPTAPAAPPRDAKNLDRLSWEVEEVPTRISRSYDTLAMFALPQVEPVAWSERPARLADGSTGATGATQAEREPRRAAILPPSRPPAIVAAAQHVPAPNAGAAEPEERGLTVLGWRVPGADLLAGSVPSGRDALRRVAALGETVAGAGKAVAETVGLR